MSNLASPEPDSAAAGVAEPDSVSVIASLLHAPDATIRCAAARALGACGDTAAAPDLIEALLAEDPDVRSDAMAALVRCARPQDAAAIRRSLTGDPVREVKVSAISALQRLGDSESIALLRHLAGDRCDGEVAWEDETDVWDDWLDVQEAAISALGILRATEAIPDLLAARADELGQDLDHTVFAAIAAMPENGIPTLLDLFRDGSDRTRVRIVRALSSTQPELLAPMSSVLTRDSNSDIRRLAIPALDAGDTVVDKLILHDSDPAVRQAALAAFAAERPELARSALTDPDESVRAEALSGLAPMDDPQQRSDVAANLEVWMQTAGPELAMAAATALPAFAGDNAARPLRNLVSDTERPLQVRMAALGALGSLSTDCVLMALRDALADPNQQVRTASLAAIAEIARRNDAAPAVAALGALIEAIAGQRLSASPEAAGLPAGSSQSAAASRFEDGPRRIRLSRDGEIINDDEPDGSNVVAFPSSTLDAIQTEADVSFNLDDQPGAEAPDGGPVDTDGNRAGEKARRRRVPVDGPDDIATDLRIVAMRVGARLSDSGIEDALVSATEDEDLHLRSAAHEALAVRAADLPLGREAIVAAERALAGTDRTDPGIRAHAARALLNTRPGGGGLLDSHVDDPEPSVRCLAVRSRTASDPAEASAYLTDPSPAIRWVALGSLLAHANDADTTPAVQACVETDWIEGLAHAVVHSSQMRYRVLGMLGQPDASSRHLRTCLEALAQSGTRDRDRSAHLLQGSTA